MHGIIIASDLKKYLQDNKGSYGQVHSVFTNTVNVLTQDHQLISLFSDVKDIAPMSLILDQALYKNKLKKEMEVLLLGDTIEFPQLAIRISCKNSVVWPIHDASDINHISQACYQARLDKFEKVLFDQGNDKGILNLAYQLNFETFDVSPNREFLGDLNDYSQFILNRIQTFLTAIAERNTVISGEYLRKIIGFGPGLTPSVDDFVAGLMSCGFYLAAFYDMPIENIRAMNEHLLTNSIGKTTTVSENMLKHAAKGLVSRNYRAVFVSLFKSMDLKIEATVSQAICFGETSGTDFLLGVYVANRMFLSKAIREVYSDC